MCSSKELRTTPWKREREVLDISLNITYYKIVLSVTGRISRRNACTFSCSKSLAKRYILIMMH